jgi:hypothetical protein
MKVLTIKNDVVTIQLDDGRILLVKEEEFLIQNGNYVNKIKVGYNDAEIMSIALREIFRPEHEELIALRKMKIPTIFKGKL